MNQNPYSHVAEPLMDNDTYQEFVTPHITVQLCKAGLLPLKAIYLWRIINGTANLTTGSFDPDHYYKDAQPAIDKFIQGVDYLPALRIKDMDRLLPDYTISRVNIIYSIMIDHNYKVEPVSDRRLPDAMALMVLDCIKSKIIDADEASNQIGIR
jgi:hypothetical protein